MKRKGTKQEQRSLYAIGWCLIGVFVCFLVIGKITNVSISSYIPPCLLHRLTPFYCPGCGGTRACLALMRGDIWLSIQYHPLVCYAVVIFIWFMVSNTIQMLSRDKIKIGLQYREVYLYVGIALVALNFLMKNYSVCRQLFT